jgi:dynein heavy chain
MVIGTLRIESAHTYVRGHILLFAATAKANKKIEAAAVKRMEIEEQMKTIAAEKSEAEAALSEALPALEAARLALSELDKSDITEIRLQMHASDNKGPTM